MAFQSKNIISLHKDGKKKSFLPSLERIEILLDEITKEPKSACTLPQIYRLGTLAKRFDVPRTTLRLELESRRLDGFKFGNRWYVTEKAATTWLEKIMSGTNFSH